MNCWLLQELKIFDLYYHWLFINLCLYWLWIIYLCRLSNSLTIITVDRFLIFTNVSHELSTFAAANHLWLAPIWTISIFNFGAIDRISFSLKSKRWKKSLQIETNCQLWYYFHEFSNNINVSYFLTCVIAGLSPTFATVGYNLIYIIVDCKSLIYILSQIKTRATFGF